MSTVKAQSANLYTTNWCQENNNADVTYTALCEITDLFNEQRLIYFGSGNPIDLGPIYPEVNNWASTETPNAVYDQIQSDDNQYYFATTLYVGHGGPDGFYGHSDDPNNYNNPPDTIYYQDIATYTQYSDANQFVFNWVCFGTEGQPPASHEWDPLYWNNEAFPYTWIGFHDASPWLIDNMGTTGSNGQPNIYKYWLVFFYYFALLPNCYIPISYALDAASQATGFASYASSVLATGNYSVNWPYPPYPQPGSGHMVVQGAPSSTVLPSSIYLDW